ncbi:hypothetical protein [Streptomyces sp. Cmuel-A718b]|uniref:hypothetical protein n=1 Tax=Streptomyces sp. Cmuel-A718b TaxID=697328 RepID=UPI00081F1C89|nr:hypothetical protein [Streptomyces sp. Cmuel-A718b]SCF58267.1 hypothetical protein GA0115280_102536 [Streptomyces sp. Cmuel-A718b]
MAGNLGLYQDITTAAKDAGGVDKLISNIEAAAVSKAFPKAFSQGVGACAVAVGGVAFVGFAVKRHRAKREIRAALASEAKELLTAEVEGGNNPHEEK